MNQKFANKGLLITYRHVHPERVIKEVELFDVNHVIEAEDPVQFITKGFVKPTAEGRVFLNGTYYHSASTFKSILKGEFLRMRRLNH